MIKSEGGYRPSARLLGISDFSFSILTGSEPVITRNVRVLCVFYNVTSCFVLGVKGLNTRSVDILCFHASLAFS